MVLVRWCCPRHADRQCCAVLAMLLLVMMVLVRWCRPRHADRAGVLVPPSPGWP
jgi:hypothetical protein